MHSGNRHLAWAALWRTALGLLLALSGLRLPGAPLRLELAIEEYPPLMGQKLPYGGFLTRVVKEAFALGGVMVQLLWVPNNRAITGTMDGHYDGSYGWAHAPHRDPKLLYSNSVIYAYRMVFFQRKGESYPWKKLEDLRPYRLGATIGNHYSDEFATLQAAGVLNVDSAAADASGMQKLASGRIDLFPMDQEAGEMLADATLSKEDRARITYQANAIWEVPTYVVIRRNHPQGPELIERFDRGYRKLAASGRLKRIIEETKRAIREQTQKP